MTSLPHFGASPPLPSELRSAAREGFFQCVPGALKRMDRMQMPVGGPLEAMMREALSRRPDLVAEWGTSRTGSPEVRLTLPGQSESFSIELSGEPIFYRVAGGFDGLEWADMDDEDQVRAFDVLLEDASRYLLGDFHRTTRRRWVGRSPHNVIVIHGAQGPRPLEDGRGGKSSVYVGLPMAQE